MLKLTLAALVASIAGAEDGHEFNGPTYIAKTRQAKSDQIWSKVIADPTSGGWNLATVLTIPEDPVFDTPGDEMPCDSNGCRLKTIHAQGNVAKIQWVDQGGHPYTGMFRGADTGYIRFSCATPVDTTTPVMAPGMGVKLLRDGVDSANFVSMFQTQGQDSLDFFANQFTNHVPAGLPSQDALNAHFATATVFTQEVGLSEMASSTQEGQTESPVFPWSLRFVQSGLFHFAPTVAAGYVNFMTDLATIPSGSLLYDIYATDQPVELGGVESKIGQLVTASEMTTSNWGDAHMFIRHQRMDDDLAIKPEWEPYAPKWTGPSACPFADLMQFLQ